MRRYFGRETIGYLIALAVCILLFVLFGYAAAGIAAVMLLLYAALAVVMTVFAGRDLAVQLTSGGDQEKGTAADAAVRIRSRSRLPVMRAEADIQVTNLLTGTERGLQVTGGMLPGREKVIRFSVGDACCGMLTLALDRMRIGDPLFVISKRITLPEARTDMLIRPEITAADVSAELLDQYDMESFRYADNRVGSDTSETVSIREYAAGDSMRSIHWKLSAKTDDLLVREPGLPVDNRLMVLADKQLPEGSGAARLNKIEEMTEAALSVSVALAEQGIRHRLGWYDLRELRYRTADIASSEDVYRSLPAFLSAPVSEDDADAAQRFLGAETEKNYSTYLLVTPPEGGCEDGVARLREYGFVIVYTTEAHRQEVD